MALYALLSVNLGWIGTLLKTPDCSLQLNLQFLVYFDIKIRASIDFCSLLRHNRDMVPVVLHHGIMGFDHFKVGPFKINYFGGGIAADIAKRGHPVIVPKVAFTGSIPARARQLKKTILENLEKLDNPDKRIVILAHSMGGLDARYMISRLGMADRVSALVTLSTPHRGSPYADWLLTHVNKNRGILKLTRAIGLDLAGLRDLTSASMARFNKVVIDMPQVRYFSVSAARAWRFMPIHLIHAHRVVQKAQGPNDGVVSVTSAQWGEHLGTWPADHLHVVNRRYVPEFRNRTGNVAPRYLKILDYLRQHGIFDTGNGLMPAH